MIKYCMQCVTTILFLIILNGNSNVYGGTENDSDIINYHNGNYECFLKTMWVKYCNTTGGDSLLNKQHPFSN